MIEDALGDTLHFDGGPYVSIVLIRRFVEGDAELAAAAGQDAHRPLGQAEPHRDQRDGGGAGAAGQGLLLHAALIGAHAE